MLDKTYYVYILTNNYNKVLYTGVTNNLFKRVWEHKNKMHKGFTYKYNIDKLVYFEIYNDVNDAINREKKIKAGNRQKKLDLVNKNNSEWNDLYQNPNS